MDSNNNLLNEFSLWSNTNAIKKLGKNLENKIYETATDTNQRINIGNDINNLGIDTDYFMKPRQSKGYGNDSDFKKKKVEGKRTEVEKLAKMDEAVKHKYEIKNNALAKLILYIKINKNIKYYISLN